LARTSNDRIGRCLRDNLDALAGILVQISLQGMFIAARLLIILVTFGAGMNQAVRKLD
jgi:hypothetical protein